MRPHLTRLKNVGRFSVLTLLLLAAASCATNENRSANEPGQTENQASTSGINAPATVQEATDILAALQSPMAVQRGTSQVHDQQSLFEVLIRIAAMEDSIIEGLYTEVDRGPYNSYMEENMLLLTRVRYEVEVIDKPRVAQSLMFGPDDTDAEPIGNKWTPSTIFGRPDSTDWLWPVKIEQKSSGSSFTIGQSPSLVGGSIQYETNFLAEFQEVKKLAKKRDLTKFTKGERQ